MNTLELSFRTFFSDLIFHPEHAHPEDQKKCLIISIALGIFSVGIIPLVVGLGWVVRKVVSWITEKSPAEEKTNNVFHSKIGTGAIDKQDNIATSAIERKGFQNSSGNCFFAAALQCLASVRQYLPEDSSKFNNKEVAEQTLALLDKILSGIEGTDAELNELIKKLGVRWGDAREAIIYLVKCLGLTGNSIWIHDDFNILFKAEGESRYTYKCPLVDKSNQKKLDFFMLHRTDLSKNLANRVAMDVPQLIQVPIADQPNTYDLYELVATAQSLCGHAVAYTKEQDQWLECNDYVISHSNDNAIENIKKHSLVLVYRRKDV